MGLRHWSLRVLPWAWGFRLHSWGRRTVHRLWEQGLWPWLKPLPELGSVELWHLVFPNRVFPSAGVFKTGRGFSVGRRLRAGAFLVGTSTLRPRIGNLRGGLFQPFVSLEKSRSAINALGLPNPGHAAVAQRLSRHLRRAWTAPLGASLARDPDLSLHEGLKSLELGFQLYLESGVDFFEVNESCPNTESQIQSAREWSDLMDGLAPLLSRCPAPVLIKWSVDIEPAALPALLDRAYETGFRGVVLGNTSTGMGNGLDSFSKRALEAFRARAGGGLSGESIAKQSRELLTTAVQWRRAKALESKDFAIVSVGGITDETEMKNRLRSGADLCQIYTGLFLS